MKKIIVSLVLAFVLAFSFGNVNAISEKQEQKINIFLENYFEKLEKKIGKERVVEKLQKIVKKINNLTNGLKTEKHNREILEIFSYIKDFLVLKIKENTIKMYYSYIENGELEKAFELKSDSIYGNQKQKTEKLKYFKKIYNFGEKVKINVNFPENSANEKFNIIINYLKSKKIEVYDLNIEIGFNGFGLETSDINKREFSLKDYYEELIREYYQAISEGYLKEAYDMKYKSKTSFEQFKKLYKSETRTSYEVSKIVKKGNIFSFYVDITQEYKNLEKYKTTMEIINFKLKTISTKKIEKGIIENISFGDTKAYVEWNKGVITLYLEKNGNKKIIDKQESSLKKYYFVSINGLEFIDNGNILVFRKSGREGPSKIFYNIKNLKKLKLDHASVYGITKDDKYLYTCGEMGMIGGGINIYKKSDFSFYKDLSEGKGVAKCIGYDKDKNIINYELSSYDEDLEKNFIFKREYDFNTGKIK